MSGSPFLKKPKIDIEDENGKTIEEDTINEQEEALVALIDHRTKEVVHLRQRVSYYTSQLNEAERKLEETQIKFAHLQGRDNVTALKNSFRKEGVKVERRSTSPIQVSEGSSRSQSQFPPRSGQEAVKSSGDNLKFVGTPISPFYKKEDSPQTQSQSRRPATPSTSQPIKMNASGTKVSSGSGSQPTASRSTDVNNIVQPKEEKSHRTSSQREPMGTQPKGTKRNLELKEHKELIPLIGSCSSPHIIRSQTGCFLSSQHKRKLRSLVLCPTNDQLFVTSALDGDVNLWQVQGRGSSAHRLSTTDCQSDKQRRWPEDIAWHPQGTSLFSIYSADGGDSQISILNLNKGKEKARVTFLEDKPHVKGIINSIIFTPWDESCFVTGGSDHAVVLWNEKDAEDSWKPKALHRNMHSSAVMGVAGMQHKKIVISVGADKRIIGYDLAYGRADYKHQIESKCMSVLPNPCDFNLFMVQTGTPERQLRLFDIRVRQMEIHSYGWKQESSDSQSALINQAWSPDGLYITSGSADPAIHVFDIRYNAHKPSQSIKAHQKRVFKALFMARDNLQNLQPEIGDLRGKSE
ncbi:transducin family protein/WD-40 repeat family protein [Forsythia ovata]|uniref:Transducin family protein/WD-40 repeat family protein n=1 Tax=Forsythia ovata TaxID=205694 RepID=A0ABD1PFX9_9LAMI